MEANDDSQALIAASPCKRQHALSTMTYTLLSRQGPVPAIGAMGVAQQSEPGRMHHLLGLRKKLLICRTKNDPPAGGKHQHLAATCVQGRRKKMPARNYSWARNYQSALREHDRFVGKLVDKKLKCGKFQCFPHESLLSALRDLMTYSVGSCIEEWKRLQTA